MTRVASHLIAAAALSLALTSRADAQVSPAPTDTVTSPPSVDTAVVPSSVVDTGDVFRPTPVLVPVKVSGTRGQHSYAPRAISTATKTPLPLRDIPQAVTVINRALIADQSMRGMADVVRYVPGITMGQGEGNRDQPTIRGNSTTADFFVDGVRDDAQYFRDLYNVERVEALKGSNAMIFGRGGGGGVINRVMKEADWSPVRELMLQGGSYHNRRSTLDVGQGLTDRLAGRVNAIYEDSDLFRDGVSVQRQGVHPTVTFVSKSGNTRTTLGYENFIDQRTADRGIPSFGGVPVTTGVSTFFGNPALSYSDARVHSSAATITRRTGGFTLRNTARFTTYDKIYQNIFPGAVSTDGAQVSLSGYNNAHTRRNLLNQTDLIFAGRTGLVSHTLLFGAELGRQVTDNFRNTAFFNDASTSVSVPVSSPTDFTPVTFRQSATDADNHVTNSIRSIYAQDQIAVSDHLQLLAGVRYESFGIRYHDNRTGSTMRRTDAMVSPRLGIVVKPVVPASFYASYSVSHLPSAGDQFSSLTNVTKALEPERFNNLEIGAKWDMADRLAITAAAYRLDRTNTTAPSPDNPALTVQTGSQRSKGYEVGASGSVISGWEIAAGFARQHARITSTTAAAQAGATVPVVPGSTLSLWNRYQLFSGLGLGVGVVHQTEMYAAINNTVRLPAFTRVDGAVFARLGAHLRAQMNLENLLNEKYYPLAHNNNNITPGSPRAVRLSLTTAF
ncbi:MAG: TonB-dependent siderophore receptor [Gemmatimonadaceae bacterium]